MMLRVETTACFKHYKLQATPCHLTNYGRTLPRVTKFGTRENVKDDTSINEKTRNDDQSRHLLR